MSEKDIEALKKEADELILKPLLDLRDMIAAINESLKRHSELQKRLLDEMNR